MASCGDELIKECSVDNDDIVTSDRRLDKLDPKTDRMD
jgi:hypothetical protein